MKQKGFKKYKQMDNKKVTGVLVDYTNKVKSKIEELYKNATEANKAIFLVYLINRGTSNTQGYQLNKENHRHLFSVNGVQWSSLIQPLIDNNIIMRVGAHKDGVKSESFAINNVYKWIPNDGEIKDRYTEYITMPKFIQKFLVDGFVVAGAKQTKWSKDYQYVQEDKINMEAKEEIAQLKYKMSLMEELIASMQQQINELVSNNNTTSKTIEEIEKPKLEDTPFFHDEEEIDKVNLSELTDFFAMYNSDNNNDKG